jgi:hypothetical protein
MGVACRLLDGAVRVRVCEGWSRVWLSTHHQKFKNQDVSVVLTVDTVSRWCACPM